MLFDMLKARQLACVSKSGQKCPAALRSPHGERGLKCVIVGKPRCLYQSLSSWRAWIEMMARNPVTGRHCSLSSWRAWIEIRRNAGCSIPGTSLSSWRAWIEITRCILTRCRATNRSPHGERGLKYRRRHGHVRFNGRSPHGERGLK